MPQFAELREEHAQLMAIVRRISAMIAQEDAPPSTAILAVREELSIALLAHLRAEDWILYPALLDSADPTVVDTARAFSREMGGLAGAYINHVEKWQKKAIERCWADYCAETGTILLALTHRIERENAELYPLVERLDRAA